MTPYSLTHDDILDMLEALNRRHRAGSAVMNKGGSALPWTGRTSVCTAGKSVPSCAKKRRC